MAADPDRGRVGAERMDVSGGGRRVGVCADGCRPGPRDHVRVGAANWFWARLRFQARLLALFLLTAGVVLLGLSAGEGVTAGSETAAGRGCAAVARLPDRPLRVGMVVGRPLDAGISGLTYRGFRRAVRELGVEGRMLVQGPKDEDGSASLSFLARQGFDLVIGIADWQFYALDAVASRFPDVCFVAIDARADAFPHRPKNLEGMVFRVEQPSYLAGFLAASVERQRPGRHVVSTVGGASIRPINLFIGGFQAGARRADPSVTLLNGYSGDFIDPAPCRRLALQQIARGSGVVFQVASLCGLGALEAAQENGVWGIGVDVDQSSLGSHVLTSVLKNPDVAVYRAIKSLQDGSFRPGTTVELTLRSGGVGLGKISPRVPRSVLAKLEQLRRKIVTGRIVVPQGLR